MLNRLDKKRRLFSFNSQQKAEQVSTKLDDAKVSCKESVQFFERTLVDFLGSGPVANPQDFRAIRQYILGNSIRN